MLNMLVAGNKMSSYYICIFFLKKKKHGLGWGSNIYSSFFFSPTFAWHVVTSYNSDKLLQKSQTYSFYIGYNWDPFLFLQCLFSSSNNDFLTKGLDEFISVCSVKKVKNMCIRALFFKCFFTQSSQGNHCFRAPNYSFLPYFTCIFISVHRSEDKFLLKLLPKHLANNTFPP